ncbi:MAG: heme exporter protein CcmD [Gammaproteobacteria bacterium]|nr:heme exporter protein CcmD [Gammaproteobacteria bacterium]
MMFEDWQAFIAMGGHGLYVWMAYSVAVALLIANLTGLDRERRRTRRHLQAQLGNRTPGGLDASEAP